MNVNELILTNLAKRPLMREKIKENRRKEVFDKISNIEELIYKKDRLAIEIMKMNLENKDTYLKIEEFKKIEDNINSLLKEQEFPEDYLTNIYCCDKCKDTGYLEDRVCNCVMQDLISERISESGFSNKKREKNFENFDYSLFDGKFVNSGRLIESNQYIRKLVDFAKNYCDNLDENKKGVFLHGISGSGKTFLAAAMGNYVLDKGRGVIFITANSLFDLINLYNYSFYKEKMELQNKIDLIKDIDLLIIDDLGSETLNKSNNSSLSIILDSRIENELATVITSNHNAFDLSDIYDSRVSSRIRGYFNFFPFPEEDLRKKIMNKKEL